MGQGNRDEQNLAAKLLNITVAERDLRTSIRQALRHGANLSAVIDDVTGDTTLHQFAREGRLNLLKSCQIVGGDLSTENNRGETPYEIACLADKNALNILTDPRKINEYFANLNRGIYPTDPKEAKTLSVYCNKEGQKALHIAAQIGDLSMANFAIKNSPYLSWDIVKERSPLHYAVINDHEEIVKLLIESLSCEDEIINPDGEGMTPLHYAAKNGNANILNTFIKVRKKSEVGVESTLLIDSVKVKDKKGRQLWKKKLIHLAAESGSDICIEMLLSYVKKKRLMIQAKDDEGNTPADIANERGYTHISKLLQQYAASSEPTTSAA